MVYELRKQTLEQAFPGSLVYEEQAGQIKRPAFYISTIKASKKRQMGNRYQWLYKLLIRYFPEESSEPTGGLKEAAEELYACLERLGTGGQQAYGLQMSHRIEDQVLHFFVTVRLLGEEPLAAAKMEHMTASTKTKE